MARQSEGGATGLRVEVLGPLRLYVDGRHVDVPGPRRRAILAILALASGPVSVDELLEAVWPDDVPESGRRALHSHVSRLRGHLGRYAERLVRVGSAYRLDLGPGELDATEARAALDGDGAAAGAALRAWHGTALEEFADVAPLAAEAVSLAEVRLELQDRWLEARLATGGDPQLVADASRGAAAAPLRERTALVLIEALAAEGRQAEALRAAHRLRSQLAEYTGLDPSARFAEVEQAIAAGAMERPPAPAPAPGPSALVRPASPLVGRDLERRMLHRRLDEGRLVTIVGPGGGGKTRLALEVGADVADTGEEVAVVELAGAADEAGVLEAASVALGIQAPTADAALHAIQAVLAGRRVTVLLDNCEHVLDASRRLADRLLAAGPAIRVLATSREPLGLPAEHLLRLGPLAVPTSSADPAGAPAYEAFIAHARRRVPDYEPGEAEAAVVGEVVRRLDGLPLALELAAGRVGTLGIRALRDRLGRALDVLGGSDEHRHGTLRSTIGWSYRLLHPGEQRLLRTAALLPAGFDLAAAEHLATAVGVGIDPAAALARLVDASVVAAEVVDGSARYRMLETIRAFALDELDAAGEREAASAAVVSWAVDLTATIGADARGPAEAAADQRLRSELPNLLRARDLAVELDDLDALVAMVGHHYRVLTFRGLPELGTWAVELADRPEVRARHDRATVLAAAAESAWLRGDLATAEQLAVEAMEGEPDDVERWRALVALGTVDLFRSDLPAARRRYEAAIECAPGESTTYATASLAATYAGDAAGAARLLASAFAAADVSGAPSDRAYACYARGELESLSDPDAAIESYREAVELARLAGTSFVEGVATVGLVAVWGRQGALAEALEGYRWLVDHWRRAAHWVQLWTTLRNLAGALADAGEPRAALLVLVAAEHATEASLVDGHTAAAHAELRERLENLLGDDEAASVQRRAGALPRGRVVDEALEAVEAVLREGAAARS